MLPLAGSGAKFRRMDVARTLEELQTACGRLRRRYDTLALVPTMGALHAGHGALVQAAGARGGGVAASIFVNPLQFGPAEDLARYPRDEEGDLAKLREWRCDLVWMPDVGTMYPDGGATTIDVAGPAENWEGAARPGHFRGVATVCTKLFGQVQPDRAYFGEKDWQQLQVVTRVVTDLHLPLEIVGVPTVREADGLALSSRNRFLSEDERAQAPKLHSIMQAIAPVLRAGHPAEPVLQSARAGLAADGFQVDYLALVDGPTLQALSVAQPGARLIAAAWLGAVRLLDNIRISAD